MQMFGLSSDFAEVIIKPTEFVTEEETNYNSQKEFRI